MKKYIKNWIAEHFDETENANIIECTEIQTPCKNHENVAILLLAYTTQEKSRLAVARIWDDKVGAIKGNDIKFLSDARQIYKKCVMEILL